MSEGYGFSRRQAIVSRVFAVLFLLVALHRTVTLPLALVAPQFMMLHIECEESGCGVRGTPTQLLLAEGRVAVERDPAALARLDARLEDADVRWALFVSEIVRRAPLIVLFLSVGFAMMLFARRSAADMAQGVRWLSRASVAALFLAVLLPIMESVRSEILLDGVLASDTFYLFVDMGRLVWNLMLASAAWAAVWAIAAGHRARTELSQIV